MEIAERLDPRNWDHTRDYSCDGDPVHCPNDTIGLFVKRFGPGPEDVSVHAFCDEHAPEGVEPYVDLRSESTEVTVDA